ncbi:XdhC family protein [Terriglobus roseus]|uniref:Xanthine and CO dehydrogenase maturation factor, XdhC/CoxF family n=1 Tax=Terriglobus roseus TaxID=392734 RepID=A0A1H4MAE3_9BACT|nr:XdhC/CoxI family protein [Terriglobus roseus]SEB79475.1 Xanthine and CO dehydrogenase maturation factor, XdhC/CoxF family [Terriglobus roseus]
MSLKERRDVVGLCQAAGSGASGVLFSLVAVRGSSYRRSGARLLALPDGRAAGTLSGGCLEAELLRRSAWFIRDGARLEHFSTSFDDTAEIPYGLGCGGELDLLAEPLHAPEAVALADALHATLNGEHRTIATLLPQDGQPLQRFVMDAHGDVLFASESIETEDIVEYRRTALRAAHGSMTGRIFTERIDPAQRLVIFGAGEDARPLAQLAHAMGWAVAVVDSRADRAATSRFPSAEQVLVATDVASVPVHAHDAAVLMTHSYEQDRRLLAELLPLQPRYLGVLGARHRSALLLSEAAELAGLPLADALERTHAPIGLELGGDGPEAVALSIVAQLQRIFTQDTAPPYNRSAETVAPRRMSLDDLEHLLADGPARPAVENCAIYTENEIYVETVISTSPADRPGVNG